MGIILQKGSWKDAAFEQQMSEARDFQHGTPVRFRYAICCGHRTGSNLLGEALYGTGVAGDPMEYFNLRFLKALTEVRGEENLQIDDYYREMVLRRTSPNGVFGINVKIDQLNSIFENKWDKFAGLIKNNDLVVYLYRKDKLRQAISVYLGQSRDTFNAPSDVSSEEIRELVKDVPFRAERISQCLNNCVEIEQAWLNFFKRYDVNVLPLAYEDFVANYESTLVGLLTKMGVDESLHNIPSPPMKKLSNEINAEFRARFLEYIEGEAGPFG